MTEKTTEISREAQRCTVEQIDFTQPFAILVHQNESRIHFKILTGKDCVEAAETKAAEIATNTGRNVAVFGPQVRVKTPSKEPVAVDLELDF